MIYHRKYRASGVHKLSQGWKCWKAQITFKGKNYHLGRYSTREQAEDAYAEAQVRITRALIHMDIEDIINRETSFIANEKFLEAFPLL